jgi:hypothetical protein
MPDGNMCTIEMLKAQELGYQIQQVFEIWHYPASTERLFQEYIDTFLKLKTEASGYPGGVESDVQKNTYIEDFFQKEGVRLETDKISKNPGMRAFAKLCLNSFWGRLGMQDHRRTTSFISDARSLYDYLLSGQYEVSWPDDEAAASLTLSLRFLLTLGPQHGFVYRRYHADIVLHCP